NREIEIRELVDHDRVVAAELEQTLAEPCADSLTDAAADLRRAREGEEVDASIVDQAFGELRVLIDDELEDARILMMREHTVDDVLDGDRAQRRLRGRLPDARVTADGRKQRIP